MGQLEDAISLAAHAHKGQVDKGGQPYILHPLWVMMRMSTDLERQVAVLHDVCEDGGLHIEALRYAGYGNGVCDAVEALTRIKGESYNDYIQRVCCNLTAARVKRWDLAHNMDMSRLGRVPTEDDAKRLTEYFIAYRQVLCVTGDSP